MTDTLIPATPPQDTVPPIQASAPKITSQVAMSEVKDAVNASLSSLGGNTQAAQTQLAVFLAQIQPDVDQALLDADIMSLGYLRDRLIMRAGRISLGLIYQQRILVANTITTVLRILIKVGIGALA